MQHMTTRQENILNIARKTLDTGLDFSRTTRITRATDKELIDFAEAIISWHINNCRGESLENYMLHKYPDMI